jgi:hypothetical protein
MAADGRPAASGPGGDTRVAGLPVGAAIRTIVTHDHWAVPRVAGAQPRRTRAQQGQGGEKRFAARSDAVAFSTSGKPDTAT